MIPLSDNHVSLISLHTSNYGGAAVIKFEQKYTALIGVNRELLCKEKWCDHLHLTQFAGSMKIYAMEGLGSSMKTFNF